MQDRRSRQILAVLATLAWVPLVLLYAGSATPAAAATAHPPVVVSLTFDDSTADQAQAGTIVANHGMRGTFYVISGRVGTTGYLTWSQIHALADAGHEIGGHTVSHPNLPTLAPDEIARQICNDRVALLDQGFAVRNLAYPFGANDDTVRSTAASCGYNSARGVGGIVSPNACSGCAFAETMPPSSSYLYRTRTPDSVKATTTLDDMKGYVTQAEQNGGGWVALVFHRLCPDTSCDPYSTTPTQLDAFLTWLQDRSAGGTTVATVGDVIGGAVAPAVAGPKPVPPGTADNMVANPSLETDANANGVADCWQHAGYGTNTYSWSRTSAAHTGSVAERVSVTSFTDGDRRFISQQDLGSCAPDIVVGHTYRFTGWYQTSGKTQVVAYYRTASGGWSYWSQGSVLPTSSTWAQAAWTTPAAPSSATAISIGFSLRSTGTLTVDDLSLLDSDRTPPTVTLSGPPDGSTVTGSVALSASASDASGIGRLEILVDNVVVCSAAAPTVACTWDTTAAPDHVAAVMARATDTAGNVASSATVNYTIGNSAPTDPSPSPTPTTSSPSPSPSPTTSSPTPSPTPTTTSLTPSPSPTTTSPTPTPSPTTTSPTPTPSPTAVDLLQNSSLETDANNDGVADCWQHGGYGTNTYTWSRVPTAHTGQVAERVYVSSLSSGDRRLISPQNAPSCAPAVTTGHAYRFDGWYITDAKVQVVVYYRTSSGTWTYWTQSSVLPAASAWTKVTWTTPPVPSGATALSIGYSIRSAGTLTADDLTLVDTG